MVQVIYRDHGNFRVFKWKIKDNRSLPHIIYTAIEVVIDGIELVYVRAAMRLPIDLDQRMLFKNVRWFGDYAKFILANLRE